MYSIETRQLTKKFKEKVAVDGINLQIKKGELFALLGTNGAGKTTVLRLIDAAIKRKMTVLLKKITLSFLGASSGARF